MSTTGNSVSLYFHIPFCHKKCPYCHFYVIANSKDHQKILFESFLMEIDQKFLLLKDKTIVSIYFGGGTPFLFESLYLEKILKKIFFLFSICPQVEITIEANPEDITLTKLHELKIIGINRLSIGVQSLDDTTLKTLGRSHNSEQILYAMEQIELSDFSNVSIDLMYDIPSQTVDSWTSTIKTALSFPITHLSLYNLTFEENTGFYRKKEKLAPLLPSDEDSLSMLKIAIAYFQDHQFKQYEISAFAKNDLTSKHNLGYWQGRPFLGLGPSAFSYWNFERFKNISNLSQYQKNIFQKKSIVDFKENLTAERRLKEQLAVHLRLIEGVNRKKFEEKWGPLSLETKKTLQELSFLGLIHFSPEKIQLTSKGLFFYDHVAQEII